MHSSDNIVTWVLLTSNITNITNITHLLLTFPRSEVRAFAYGAMGRRMDPTWSGPIEIFLVPAIFHDWCNKGCGMCYPVSGMVHIKEPLLLIGKTSQCGGSGFHLSLSEWSFTICATPYNRKYNVLSVSLNTKFPFLSSDGRLAVKKIVLFSSYHSSRI